MIYQWTDEDLSAYRTFCEACQITDLTVPITVWANESNNDPAAHNPHGHASGIFQLMPDTARGLGWDTDTDPSLITFRELPVCKQLEWATRYYAFHAGLIGTVASFYLCTFMPALLVHGSEPDFVVCGANGPYSWAYAANIGFDTHRSGEIRVKDLEAAAKAAQGPRYQSLLVRLCLTPLETIEMDASEDGNPYPADADTQPDRKV